MNNLSRPPKAAMLVAQRVVSDVIRNHLQPGDLLPPERSMLETYETGRGTLREALRLLEMQGVIAIKPGPRGGPVLLDPNSSHLASTVILLMQLKQAPFQTIVEVRLALEPMISSLAAARIDETALASLKQTIDNMRDNLDDQHVFLDENKRFHDIVASASGNLLFSYLVNSLLDIMDGTIIGIDYPIRQREAILVSHAEIFEAIKNRDPVESDARMRQHINEYTRYAQRRFPKVLDQVIPWTRVG